MIQIMASCVISFLVAIFFTPWLIRYFSNAGKGQEIREDGPKSHLRKRGTPTMGGLAILAGIVIAYVAVNTYEIGRASCRERAYSPVDMDAVNRNPAYDLLHA